MFGEGVLEVGDELSFENVYLMKTRCSKKKINMNLVSFLSKWGKHLNNTNLETIEPT